MWKPCFHQPMGLYGLLQGWLNLCTLCSGYFVDVNFSRCLFIFAVCYLEIRPNSRPSVNFCNRLIFYGERLLDPHPTSKLEAHSLLAVCGCLFNLLAATHHWWRPSSPFANWGYAKLWWQGTHITWDPSNIIGDIWTMCNHGTEHGVPDKPLSGVCRFWKGVWFQK
jgi:hypothetical protein